MPFEREIPSFGTARVSNVVLKRPAGGLTYVYDYSGDKKAAKDWRKDGFLWRQTGTKKYENEDGSNGTKYFFSVRTGTGDVAYSLEFSKTALTNSSYPNKVLLTYKGDHKEAIAVPHGNCTKPKTKSRGFVQTKPSLREEMKDRYKEIPIEVYADLNNLSSDMKAQTIDRPRNRKQVTNLQEAARRRTQLLLTSSIPWSNYSMRQILSMILFSYKNSS